MFNLSGEKLLVIFVVALVVLGPDHLPIAVRRVGQVMGQLRDLSEAFKREVSQALDDPGEPIVKPMSRPPLSAVPEVEEQVPAAADEPATSDDNVGAALHDETTPLNGENIPLNGENAPLNGEIASLNGENAPLHNEATPLYAEDTPLQTESNHPASTPPEKHNDT